MEEIDKILRHTLGDFRLSRGEKRVLSSIVQQHAEDEHQRAVIRSRAFEIARGELLSAEAQSVVGWLEEVVKVLQHSAVDQSSKHRSEAYFSPHDDCVGKLTGLFLQARRRVDICVFTVTDDRITEAIQQAHRRGIKIRLLTDNDKAEDIGSDVYRLRSAGVPVRTDRTSDHMHHKYAVFDQQRLLTGSYNWTRSAARHNEENFVVTNDPQLVQSFDRHFQRLWTELG